VAGLISTTGTVASQYTYDPYGNQTIVSGSASDIGYAGYFYHAVSGLDFALYRAYDPAHARWLNRDPIGEAGGTNMYAYVGGNPISRIDPQGLATLVIGSGPIASNPAGHVALAFTGQGVYSYGTADPYGASTTDYIAAALANRSVTLTILNTTPAQEEAMRNSYTKNYGPHSKYSIAKGHDCANAALDALTGADALDQQILNLLFNQDAPMLQFLPSTVVSAAFLQSGSTNVFLPQGSTVPVNLGSFNK
jgi:RHS repeat-associated protein